MTAPDPIVRPAARLLVIDARDRLLLMAWDHPALKQRIWIAPGGGVEPGETFEQAAARELREETGIDAPLGPCVWHRAHIFEFGDIRIDQRERFYVVCVAEAELTRDGWTPEEQKHIGDVRWWTAGEIAMSPDWFAPRGLAHLAPPILAGRYPAEPFDCGI